MSSSIEFDPFESWEDDPLLEEPFDEDDLPDEGLEGHRERLRRRVDIAGWDTLRPQEMLELLLACVVPRQDVAAETRALLEAFGSVGGVFCASPEELAEVEGVTDAIIEWIGLAAELVRAYRDVMWEDDILLSCNRDVRGLLRRWPVPMRVGLWGLFIDFGYSMITYDRLDVPEIWWAPASFRVILKEILASRARYVVLARFCPGPPAVNPVEIRRLKDIIYTLEACDVHVLDYLLVSEGQFTSLYRAGRLDDDRLPPELETMRHNYLMNIVPTDE